MPLIGRLIGLKFHQLLCSLGLLVVVFMVLLLTAPKAIAQGLNFNCDVVFYQVKNTTTVSQIVKFSSVGSTVTPTGVYAATQTPQMNSIGYNAVDNFMYGISSVTATPTFYRIGDAGYAAVGTIANSLAGGLALSNTFFPTGGVFDAAGRYYFAGQGGGNLAPAAIFRVDSIPISGVVQVSHQYNLSPTAIVNMGDFDFNGAGSTSGLLLGAVGTNLYRIQLTPNNSNPALGTASVVTVTIANVGAIGSAFYDAAALKFYVFDNGASQFWEIQNAEAGIPNAVATIAPGYIGPAPFNVPTGASPTDGTSCPISGTRRADLRITKTDNITTIPTGGVTSYVITVANNGPYPANYSVISDPAVTGLSKLSVTCAASAGPPTAVCPATLSVASLEAGLQIITFPPTTTLTFTVNALVTQTAGSFVTNTAIITPAADTTLITPTFTVAIDVNTVTPAATTVSSTISFCPAGTTENLTNLVANSDFSAVAPFATQVTLLGANAYTANSNSVSKWAGTANLAANGITQNPFSGDSSRSVLGSNNWLLSNGKTTGSPNHSLWLQPVTGLVIGRTYQFMTYQSNAITVGTSSPTLPDLRLMVNQTGVTTTISVSTPLATETVGSGGDRWRLVQGTFTATVSAVTLSIADFSAASATETGAVAGISQATLRACDPAADVSVTKTNGTNTIVSGGTTAYTITVANLTVGVNATNTLIVDPGVAGLVKSTITCVFTAGSLCPVSLSVLGLEGAGLLIPRVNALGTVTFIMFANVTGAPGTTATNIVTVSGVGYTDPNPANNQAQDADFIRGTASLSVTKNNFTSTVAAGSTTSYTVTVSLTAGAQVVGAVLTDPVAPGLSCTSVTCTSVIGATSCPSAASTTIAALQGAGIVLPSMSAPSSIIFNIVCGVRATGV